MQSEPKISLDSQTTRVSFNIIHPIEVIEVGDTQLCLLTSQLLIVFYLSPLKETREILIFSEVMRNTLCVRAW